MKTEYTTIDKIKKILNKDIEKSQINLAMETLNEGEATIEAEIFEAGQPVMIVNEDERIPLPVGEYLLDNGMTLVVEEEGVIASVGEKSAEENEEEVAASDNQSETPLPKAVIESVVKETKFSKEDIELILSKITEAKKEGSEEDQTDAKDAKIVELEAKIAELEKVEEELGEVELAKPVAHNPEAKAERLGFKIGANGKATKGQSIMEKIANIK